MEALGGGGAPLFVLDFIVIGAVKRSMSLSSALALLVPAKNAVLSRAVLRMEIDTLARLLAYTYVANPQDVAQAVIGGKSLRDFKSKNGKQLTDRYPLFCKQTSQNSLFTLETPNTHLFPCIWLFIDKGW